MSGLWTVSAEQEAWVVFSGQTDIRWLRWLKPGFRHCYVLLNDGQRWTSLDPLSHVTEVSVHHHLPISFNLPAWLEARGNTVVKTFLCRDIFTPAPFMLFTCVEAVKRVLGVHRRGVLTPWQLYQFLKKRHSHKKGDSLWAM